MRDKTGMSIRINDADGSRTVEQAKQNIADRTRKETLLIPVVEAHYASIGFPMKIINNGVDNSGKFISDEDAKALGREMGKADWACKIDDKIYYIEAMVHTERFNKCSFKEHKLRRHAENGDTIMVLRETHFDVYKTPLIKELLTMDMEPLKGFGWNTGLILYNWRLKELLDQKKLIRHYWSPDALVEMEKIKDQAFRLST